jgi:hypothetical protein
VNTVLSELGQKLVDRWLAVLVLPSMLFTAGVIAGLLVGQDHALDVDWLLAGIDRQEHALHGGPTRTAALVGALLLAALGATLLARAVAAGLHRAFISRRPRLWVRQRRAWALARRGAQPGLDRYLPTRVSVGECIDAEYGLSLPLVWPRLWLVLADGTREIVQRAYDRYRAEVLVCAWGLLCCVLAGFWWPAVVPGLVALAVGWTRCAAAAGVLSELVEAAVDTHQHALADALGIPLPQQRITPQDGLLINDLLHKRR